MLIPFLATVGVLLFAGGTIYFLRKKKKRKK